MFYLLIYAFVIKICIINSLIFLFLVWKTISNSIFFQKLIGIIGFSRCLNKYKLFFKVLIKKFSFG